MNCAKLCFVLVLHLCRATVEAEKNEVYGKDWVIFVDNNGKPHHVSLSIPKETTSLSESKPVSSSAQPRFWLYTRNTINKSEEILTPIQNETNYDRKSPLVVLVHGWLCNRDSDSVQFIKNAILTTPKRNDNVIIVDWSSMQSWNYIISAEKTLSAAEKLKDFVQRLANVYQIHGTMIHFIGHSLGAHVVGLAGRILKLNNFTVSRVTGLDPASPFFELPAIYPGISRDAAAFVDIIHTNIGILGISEAAGHADFYPGGGVHQPALCPSSIFPGWCEHSSAYIYFQKSLTKKFNARKCHDYFMYTLGLCDNNEVQVMGEACEPTARGSYFLDIKTIN